MASQLEQQQENLRRVVDKWRSRSLGLLGDLSAGDPIASLNPKTGPIGIRVEPVEHAALSSLIDSDNAVVSKLVTVLSFDCIEIAKLQKLASRNLYRQLMLFGHRASPQEVLLEGEPQKAFAESLPLFMELYETVRRLREVLGNLVQQLIAVYSVNDKNVRPLNSVKNFELRSAFESLGEGLAVLLVLDEILKQNGQLKSYLSLFARMLNNMKLELDTFGISVDDLDFLDQVVKHLEKLLGVGFFQHLLQGEPSWNATFQTVRSNRKFIETCTSCFCDGLPEFLARLDTWKEYPFDRRKILQYLALFLFSTYSSGEAPEKKTWKLIVEMLQLVPVIHVEGGKRILILDLLKSQCHPLVSSWLPARETSRDSDVMMRNYLTHLSDMQSRDWQAIRDSLSSWVASFQSAIHPSSEILSEACLRLHLKQIMQGILLAYRMRTLVLSMLDLHAMLEVPIKREKLRSLCHMIISLKVLGNTFQIKAPEIMRSLPHIINVIQTDMEQFILPLKAKLHAEVVKGCQASKLGILNSLRRGGRDTDTRLPDSLTLVLISLQLLQGGGSLKRQLILSTTMDVLQSIGSLDIDFLRIRKHMLKLATVTDFHSIVEEVTNCSFLYWRKEIMGSCFSIVYTDVNKFSWLQNLLDAFSDGLWLLKLGHVGKLTLHSFENEIESALENEIIAPFCRDVETDLRLHVHSSHLKGSVFVNPTKTGVRDLSWYLQMRPLRLLFKSVDVRSLLESYLNSAFYNHTAMSSNDWKMYSEMQQLAELKYGLALDDIHLTKHSQNFDINEVIQNLPTFVEKYSYSMVRQIFILKFPNDQSRKNLKLIDNDCVGDYFKREVIGFAWELLTKEYKLPVDRIYVTYFRGDEKAGLAPDNEARDIWLEYLPPGRVLPFGCKENFWEMGDTGPCGPCSEIHFDRIGNRDAASLVNNDDPTCIEIWNLVFIQFNRETDGSLKPLPAKHVDTGMGFERLTSILQQKMSNYDTDVFMPIFDAIQKATGAQPYAGRVGSDDVDRVDMAYRVVADHIRTLCFAIADGSRPGNEGREYVLRRILRRAVRYGTDFLKASEGFFSGLVDVVVKEMGYTFPELKQHEAKIKETIAEEEASFVRTLDRGREKFRKAAQEVNGNILNGQDAFVLWDTYGFPIDLTQLMAEEKGLTVDVEGFNMAMDEARKKARSGRNKAVDDSLVLDADATSLLQRMGVPTTDDSYKFIWNKDHKTVVKAIYRGADFIEIAIAGSDIGIVLESTNFYAEQGGQIYDTGFLEGSFGSFQVSNVQVYGGYVLHIGSFSGGTKNLLVGDEVICKVDYGRRTLIAPNHTCTHMLNFALREVLGDHVDQKGSIVLPEKLRFDFSHGKPIHPEDLRKIEAIVNKQIKDELDVFASEANLAVAKCVTGLRAVFGEVYPDPVRIVSIGRKVEDLLVDPENKEWLSYSTELCGGTHISNTREAKAFALLSEEGIAKGVRRVTAVTTDCAISAKELANSLDADITDASKEEGSILEKKVASLKSRTDAAAIPAARKADLRARISQLEDQLRKAKKKIGEENIQKAVTVAIEIAEAAASEGKTFCITRVDVGVDTTAVREAVLKVMDQKGLAVMVFN